MYENDPKAVEWINDYEKKLKDKPYTRWRKKLKSKLYNIIGGAKCSNINCLVSGGCTDIRCLQIDHIITSCKRDVRVHGSYRNMILYYVNHPEEAKLNLQILCANCNWIKRYSGDNYLF